MSKKNTAPSPFQSVLEEIKPILKNVLFFGLIINVLSLAPTIYMLEVYDRVVNSRNANTLVMLTLLVLGMYLLMEILEWVRGQLLYNAGVILETKLGERAFNAVFESNLRRVVGANQILNDLRTLREFFSTPVVTSLMDAPMALLFLVLLFLISPVLGWFSLIIAVIQVYIAYLTERTTQPPITTANRMAIAAQNYASSTLRNAQVIEAMGMLNDIQHRWMEKQRRFIYLQAVASDHAGGKGAAAKIVQNILSSGLLGLSCWLMLNGELAGGGSMMIISSILGSKVLAPLVQVIATWKTMINARDAYQRFGNLLQAIPEREIGMPLPPPRGAISVEGVVAAAPGSQMAILRNVTFGLPAGKALVIVGPSAAGKSTLARLLVGVWPASSGKVRLDGVDVYPWNKAELGPHLGYLPQGIELFDGTLAENIARFGEVDMTKVMAASRAVGLHDAIVTLPEGYDSRIGDEGCFLSGGQRQRVGLARAIYGEPKFVVLDEPNSSLDEAGEQALLQTMQLLKSKGVTLIIISHRTSVLPIADVMLILRDGQVIAYGPRDEVLAALAKAQQPAKVPASTS
ncbi:Alkaline protease secretion ATP-binding protein AprD [Gammaproteobacteria bacterium]